MKPDREVAVIAVIDGDEMEAVPTTSTKRGHLHLSCSTIMTLGDNSLSSPSPRAGQRALMHQMTSDTFTAQFLHPFSYRMPRRESLRS